MHIPKIFCIWAFLTGFSPIPQVPKRNTTLAPATTIATCAVPPWSFPCPVPRTAPLWYGPPPPPRPFSSRGIPAARRVCCPVSWDNYPAVWCMIRPGPVATPHGKNCWNSPKARLSNRHFAIDSTLTTMPCSWLFRRRPAHRLIDRIHTWAGAVTAGAPAN